jgi:hypothetical protein
MLNLGHSLNYRNGGETLNSHSLGAFFVLLSADVGQSMYVPIFCSCEFILLKGEVDYVHGAIVYYFFEFRSTYSYMKLSF